MHQSKWKLKKNCCLSDYIKQEEGRALSIPCIAPYALQNFSLTWTFVSSSEPVVILRYDTKNRHIFNVWEDHAELDPEQLLLSNASLLLHKPNIEEHSGLYTCIISGVQSKHIIQTDVNITASSVSKCHHLQNRYICRERWNNWEHFCRWGRAKGAEVMVVHCSFSGVFSLYHRCNASSMCEAKK